MRVADCHPAILVAFLWEFNFVVIEAVLDTLYTISFFELRFICAAFPAMLFWRNSNISWRWIVFIGLCK